MIYDIITANIKRGKPKIFGENPDENLQTCRQDYHHGK
jgi:hypothetical protein